MKVADDTELPESLSQGADRIQDMPKPLAL